MSDDKVTLEWLMRFEGVEEVTPVSQVGKAVIHRRSAERPIGIWAGESNHGTWLDVVVKVKDVSVTLNNPTVARFHEAVAFLGGNLAPLRPGEA
jgi:hypothetical protein